MKKHLPFRRLLAAALALQSLIYAADAQTLAASRPEIPVSRQPDTQQTKSLKEVLAALEAKYHISFSYDRLTVDNKQVKPGNKGFTSLEDELRHVLQPLRLSFEKLGDNLYLILPAAEKVPKPVRKAVSQLESAAINAAISITGTVKDENGNGLPGVTVLLKGTATGTSTSLEGQYALSVPDEQKNGTLVFSYIGYLTEEVPVSGQTTIDVTLLPDVKALSEVVVIGYGTQKKRDVTGAVSSISEEKIKALPVSRFEQALQGRISGVNVTSNSGAPGGSVAVRIRGIGTVGNNQPLFVIDGIPVFGDQALSSINPNDIQSIEVLKDASATAIYGARAANGVVIVTTKRGKEGKISLSYDGYGGVQQLAKQYDLLNAEQFALLSNEMRSAQHTDPLTPEWGDPANIPGGVDTDWQKEIFRTAAIQNHALSLSGGGENSQYLISGNYFDQEGTVKGSDFTRYSLRVNTDAKVFNRLKMGTSLLFSRTDENTTGNAGRIETALRQLPSVPVQFPDGTWGGPQGAKEYYNDQSNPVAEIDLFDNRSNRNRFLGNLFGEIELFKGLSFRSSYSADISMREDKSFTPTYQFGVLFRATAGLNQVNARNFTQILENSLSFNRTFAQKHTLSAVAVYSAQVSKSSSVGNTANGLISNSLPYLNANTGNLVLDNGDTFANEWAILSYTGRVNYAFADKYLLSATVRRDGSSRFGKTNQYATFPAFSVGWRLSEEGFMQGIGFISDLKLRGSWGQSGNQEIGLYGYLSSLAIDRRYVLGPGGAGQAIVPGVGPTSLANPDMKWETATQTNVGFDLGLLNNQLTLTGNYFVKKTTDMLVQVPIPQFSGITVSPFVNAGSMENRGVELEINYVKNAGTLRYEIGGNITTVQNKVLSLGGGRPIFSGNFLAATNGRGGQNVTITREGDPVGSFYGYIMEGIFQNQAEIEAHAVQGTATRPGDVKFKDVNGDYVINAEDRALIGNPIPRLTYGLNGSLNYKGFDLSLFFQGVQGNELYNGTRTRIAGMFAVENQTTEVLARWRGEGTSNTVPLAVQLDPAENGRNSTRWIEDGSYLRLKNLTVGYTLPQPVAQKIRAQRTRLYVSGTNLLTFTQYTGLDPEVGERGQSALFYGVDHNIYPVARTFTLGLNVNF